MRLEDIRYEFPEMPEEMRRMVEREVEKQVTKEHIKLKRRGKAAGRTFAASLAAVVLVGTTVFAGVGTIWLRRHPVGDHGVEVTMKEQGSQTAAASEVTEIPDVTMELGYLPQGMVETEEGKYSFEDALYEGGVSIVFYRMDTGDAIFDMLHKDVVASEDLNVNGYQGVYLEFPKLYEDMIAFNQQIYVAYTDVHYVMQMYAASDVSKEEALKIAEGIKLMPAEDGTEQKLVHAWDWSSYLASEKDNVKNGQQSEEVRLAVSKEEMKNTHQIGESFSADLEGAEEQKGLCVKVSDVRIADDISLLNPDYVDDDIRGETDAAGKLLPATIQYIRKGNEDSLSEVVKEEHVAQKLVYVTVEYTNTGEQKLSDVLFFGSLMRLAEDGDRLCIVDRGSAQPQDGDEWTTILNRGLSDFSDMLYYDVRGGERDNNYIAAIEPGETVSVHMAWLVTEDELGKLYLNLDTGGSPYEFSDRSLAMGLVDIRQ